MKRIILSACILVTCTTAKSQETKKDSIVIDSFYLLTPVEVRAIRAAEDAPFAKTNITRLQLAHTNLGQDIPFLLNQTPSVVINSDAGNGIGYTGIRIRGTDASRINVTLNGIPYNDAESQGTFFVDLPDFTSSVASIQVLRGVGTSSNGSGAYGASINFSTNELNIQPYLELNNSYGSFNSWKNTIRAGTGLHNGFFADIRLSHISSDGYIDRASSRLRSGYLALGWSKKKNSVRLNLFSGHEKTYQAWYGISQSDLDAGNRTVNYAGTERPGTPYDNETDNYTQTHAQLFFNHNFNERLTFNTAIFCTWGKGYYEQYKADQDYAFYGLPYPIIGGDTIFSSDFVRQLWLDNKYFGNIFSLYYKTNRTKATLGGSVTRYDGNHYGRLIWASKYLTAPYTFYDLDARKSDLTIYLKEQTDWKSHWAYYYDLQFRHVNYDINGFRENPSLIVKNNYNFFNPKVGFLYHWNKWKAFVSYAVANKEPNRDDFEAGISQQPKPERLFDLETGVQLSNAVWKWAATFFYMKYRDQLVLTGKINDVGAYTRTNIPKSYRCGIELEGSARSGKWLIATVNFALSANKVLHFTEYIDDYDNGSQKINLYSSTNIALSPSVIGSTNLTFIPLSAFECSWIGKYVSRQYLDNTQMHGRSLDPYWVNDLSFAYKKITRSGQEIELITRINNLFSVKYEPNGYTYSYIYGGSQTTENYYFPMAGINLLIALNVKF